MSVIRFPHVLVLSLLLALVLLSDTRAAPAGSPVPLARLTDTRWQVIEIDGTAYPETRSPIVIRFTAGAIHVDQTCMPFLTIPDKDGVMKIWQLDSGLLCFMRPPEESRIQDVFRSFSHVERADENHIRVVSEDSGDLVLRLQASTGQQP